ncbi:hypothetical protein L7F22_025004 [Adiantum nelumboides]|nr:hypothetical protein [Adiantum nelumboides]
MFSVVSVAVTWSGKKQPIVALSSTEAEYRGATVAACEHPASAKPCVHARTKHIEVHYHFIRERVLDGDIDLTYVGIEDHATYLFIKALGAKKL